MSCHIETYSHFTLKGYIFKSTESILHNFTILDEKFKLLSAYYLNKTPPRSDQQFFQLYKIALNFIIYTDVYIESQILSFTPKPIFFNEF